MVKKSLKLSKTKQETISISSSNWNQHYKASLYNDCSNIILDGLKQKLKGTVDGLEQKLKGSADGLKQKLKGSADGLEQKLKGVLTD